MLFEKCTVTDKTKHTNFKTCNLRRCSWGGRESCHKIAIKYFWRTGQISIVHWILDGITGFLFILGVRKEL